MNKLVQDLCNGCVTPITAMPFYKCTYDGCDFVLHDWCTRLPTKIKGHIDHPQHPLILLPKLPPTSIGIFRCDTCYKSCNGFAYSCVECNRYIDVHCALVISKSIRHESHPRHLLERSTDRRGKFYCRVCLSDIDYHENSFNCYDCNFSLHLGCALLLPKTIRHKYDKHPMTITYSPVENHWGDYFCEVCEEEVNPNASFYHCHKCMQSIHVSCAPLLITTSPLIPQIKAFIDYAFTKEGVTYGQNIKPGSIHMTKDHPHPLTLLKGTETDGQCLHNKCGGELRYELIVKCLQCKFKAHYGHVFKL